MSENNKLVELNTVTKIYRDADTKVFALLDVSFSVINNDYLAVVGPSGSGKSTLLHIMGGLDIPTAGEVLFQGKDIYKMGERKLARWRNKTIGFVFQFYYLIEELNVLENVALGAFLEQRKLALKSAQGLLEYLGIEKRRKFFPSQLSGGEKQKVAIARALVSDPDILLCDEPTGNLDKDSQDKVVEFFEKLNREKGKIIVLVTHNLELAKRAKRILPIEGGQIR